MLDLTEHYFELLLGAMIVGLCIHNYVQRAEQRRLRRLIRRERNEREALAGDVAALLACSRTIGARVKSHDATQYDLRKKLEKIDVHPAPDSQPGYERVYKLVAQGLSVDEIADICDLGRGEVELLSHMAEHRSAA